MLIEQDQQHVNGVLLVNMETAVCGVRQVNSELEMTWNPLNVRYARKVGVKKEQVEPHACLVIQANIKMLLDLQDATIAVKVRTQDSR